MTYLMSHVICLNNTYEWFYDSSSNSFEKIPPT